MSVCGWGGWSEQGRRPARRAGGTPVQEAGGGWRAIQPLPDAALILKCPLSPTRRRRRSSIAWQSATTSYGVGGAAGSQFDFTVAEGLGAATRLLDVGCGTGALVAAAVERLGVKAWGVDASEPMLARARERGVRGAAFKLAQADDLPFRKAWFDAVTMRLVVHALGDRRRARACGGAPGARAGGPPLRLDVRPGPLHGAPPEEVPARSPGDRSRALPVRRDCS